MNAPDTVLLADLAIGECFQFAQHRSRKMEAEQIPKWKLINVGADFWEVTLEKPVVDANPSHFPTVSIRLAGSTIVRKVSAVSRDENEEKPPL